MATIRAYTTIEQSRKLAEILPLESADMVIWGRDLDAVAATDAQKFMSGLKDREMNYLPCWSLAALLDVLNKTTYFMDEDASVNLSSYKTIEWDLGIDNSDLELVTESNPIDACYEMIIKLYELNLL